MLTQAQVAEAEAIQDRVRAKFCPNWRQQRLEHFKALGVAGPRQMDLRQFAKRRNTR